MLDHLPTQQHEYLLHDRHRTLGVGVGQQQRELFAAVAHRQVARALQCVAQQLANAPQTLVTRQMAVAVVIGLEVVQSIITRAKG